MHSKLPHHKIYTEKFIPLQQFLGSRVREIPENLYIVDSYNLLLYMSKHAMLYGAIHQLSEQVTKEHLDTFSMMGLRSEYHDAYNTLKLQLCAANKELHLRQTHRVPVVRVEEMVYMKDSDVGIISFLPRASAELHSLTNKVYLKRIKEQYAKVENVCWKNLG